MLKRIKCMTARAVALVMTMVIAAMMLPISASASFKTESRNSVAVVGIYLDLDQGEFQLGWGTGFFVGTTNVNPQYLVTCYHVIRPFIEYGSGERTTITTDDGQRLTGRAKIRVYYDSNDYVEGYYVDGNRIKDVALLKLDKPTGKRTPLPLCVPTDSMVGTKIFAVGYPGLAQNNDAAATSEWGESDATVTSGTISRIFTTQGTGVNLVQVDCVFRRGNSGGPMLNENGAVIGINSWSRSDEFGIDEDIYYSISVNEIIPFLKSNSVEYEMLDGSAQPAGGGSDGNNAAADNGAASETPAVTEPLPPAQPEQEKGMSTGLLVGIIIGGVALVGIIIVVIVLASKKKPAPAPVPQNAPQQPPKPQKRPAVRSSNGAKAYISGSQILIGRSVNDCGLVFPEGTPGISGRHCSLSYDGSTGEFVLTDLKSTYGTFLQNGQKLTPGVPFRLHEGDSFYLGERNNLLTVGLE